jgi:hypothetical protein
MNMKLKITFVTFGIVCFLHFLNSLLPQQQYVSAPKSVSVFRWNLGESLSELDPLGRAVFFSNTRPLLPDVTQPGAYKSLSFEEQKVQRSEIWSGAVGRTISPKFRRIRVKDCLTLKLTLRSFETSANTRQATQRHISKQSKLRQHRCENLKSCNSKFDFIPAVYIFVISASTDKCTQWNIVYDNC